MRKIKMEEMGGFWDKKGARKRGEKKNVQ